MECRICGSREEHDIFEVKEMMYGTREIFKYFQCRHCGCLQISDFPADMQRHYSGAYYSYQRPIAPSGLKRIAKNLKHRYATTGEGLLGKIMCERSPFPAMDSLRPLRLDHRAAILDVGCGAGILLHALRELGYRDLLGVDPFVERDIEYPNGLQIRKIDVHAVQGQWDVIMFHHSFEHLSDPYETLQSVLQRLKPGGHCILRVPTVSSYAWDHYGVNWIQLDAPRHFFLYSTKSIEVLAERLGMTLGEVAYDSTEFQFWGSEEYVKNIAMSDENSYARHPVDSMFSEEDIKKFVVRAKELNRERRGDQAVFYLKKSA